MRKLLPFLGAVALFGATAGAQSQKSQADAVGTLKVSGMQCSACAKTVESAAAKIDGVKLAKADQPKGTAEVTYDATQVTLEQIASALAKKTGFTVEAPKRTAK